MTPSIGRIVHYRLSDNDLRNNPAIAGGVGGNAHQAGDVVPMIIVRVWPDEHGAGIPGVNGQAFLDGRDSCWVTSAKEGTEGGQWSWPERVA